MKAFPSLKTLAWCSGALLCAALAVRAVAQDGTAKGDAAKAAPQGAVAASASKAALTVGTVRVRSERWARTLAANGSIAAWQEAVIGAESQGLRLVEVRAQVGDRVAKGALLARLQDDTLQADLAVARATLAEAEAALAEAQANAERARQLQPSGALSAQQIQQYATAETTARARVASAKARLEADGVRLAQTRIVAPDAGVVSSRSATLGAVVSPGTELFRLIRQGRLEWRAEVPAADLAALQPGTPAEVVLPGGATLQGKVRTVAPTVEVNTRNGLVYVDLPGHAQARAGTFARGQFRFGETPAATLPQTAVVLRDGFHQVLQVQADHRLRQWKVEVGRRQGDRVEILTKLPEAAEFVAQGGGFLADGDVVRVAPAPAAAAASR
jgi:RND family efflux transporter MFP subunit